MPILASIAVFGSVVLFALWFVRSKNQMEDRVRELSAQRRAIVEKEDPFSQRVMFPFAQASINKIIDYLPTSLIARSRKWLLISDTTMSLPTFMAITLVTSTLLPALGFAALWTSRGGSPGQSILLVPAAFLLGLAVPVMFLRRAARQRQERFWKALPDSLDLLTTCVEAGLSLDFAFQRVAERQKGPVGDEISRMLREKALGQTRKEALQGMAERIDLPDVNVFVASVIQAETLGTSIAQVLRVQARQLRIRRRQRAEQLAGQAAPKMVFPLVFFVMPSIFIVILGPILINAYRTLG